jgi:hypothetical protein
MPLRLIDLDEDEIRQLGKQFEDRCRALRARLEVRASLLERAESKLLNALILLEQTNERSNSRSA